MKTASSLPARETDIVPESNNPIWNEEFCFSHYVPKFTIELWDSDGTTKDDRFEFVLNNNT